MPVCLEVHGTQADPLRQSSVAGGRCPVKCTGVGPGEYRRSVVGRDVEDIVGTHEQ